RAKAICSSVYLDLFTTKSSYFLIVDFAEELTLSVDLFHGSRSAGQVISYWLKPLFGVRTSWVTEITHVQEPVIFVDEQRLGPYAFWHHQHHFKESGCQTIVRDEVNYALPYGPLGSLVHAVWIRKKLKSIFEYRQKALLDRFPENKPMP
ncbi:MAG: hypothetical protein AB7E51_17130, partial [Pseudodesulfovibrio sp.]|uniref:SRPBCC family protein n=1 Tax=Pseudodesulfovibrio sp. TaxID=2035812 RepID=UPI003D127FE2